MKQYISYEKINDWEFPFNAEVVLLEPEIPQNTGNIIRTCTALGCRLHLVEPLGFSMEDRYLRRAGLDYRLLADVKRYPGIDAFFESHGNHGNPDGKKNAFFFLSRKGKHSFYDCEFQKEQEKGGTVFFFFGRESVGLPDPLIEKYRDQCFRIPMRPGIRSLNIANAVAVVLYEALRQVIKAKD
ncbi:MAG: tRNA (cytidine(34)-2'-O)-methyltransferase [bacterium]|nr:tRNA (cytidine(34)-2'-O)-methyltransferase [bacterium]